jgi:hypothetical protein
MPQFPGMNPYLEGYLFQDLHSALAGRIRAFLTPLLRPRYAARLEVSVVQDSGFSEDLGIVYPGIVYPDVEVVTASPSAQITPVTPERSAAFTPAPLSLPPPIKIRIPTIEVREIKANRLVTYIEIVSYANKRQPGFEQYLQKRSRLIATGVHLVEIDLIRRGSRPIADPLIPQSAYQITVTRANDQVMVWAVQMDDPLPTIPVPLIAPDPDVPLNLGQAIAQVYAEADYDLTIDYSRQPPAPALSEQEQEWLKARIG